MGPDFCGTFIILFIIGHGIGMVLLGRLLRSEKNSERLREVPVLRDSPDLWRFVVLYNWCGGIVVMLAGMTVVALGFYALLSFLLR